jgi:hypothetical protein
MGNYDDIKFDIEISPGSILDLSSPDGVAVFFTRLGYDTDRRTGQIPESLGITASTTLREIRHIELIADHDGLLQVYLFELNGVTMTNTRALVRAFRNRTGNYLLVLTSDYERLDFVLVERYAPPARAVSGKLGLAQAGVRPRVLSIDRRHPSPVQIRVLKRLTYTEDDPFAQYDKILSAYTIADWSEEYFNNKALFSDYFLLTRLRETEEWEEDPKPILLTLSGIYRRASAKFAGVEEALLRKELFEPIFKTLGFQAKVGKKANSPDIAPDYRLYSPGDGDKPLAVVLVYTWGRSLDGKDNRRDNVTPEENPGAVVVSLLEQAEAPWAIVTNGKLWRLYSSKASSRSGNYYEIDLEEVLASLGPETPDLATMFRYFWLFFRREAFEPRTREGIAEEETARSFLDEIFTGSEEYAKELGERLKERVFEEIFPLLAEGFFAYMKEQGQMPDKVSEVSEDDLRQVFQGTLTLLYRLLFLLYAEARDLLPVRETRGYYQVSLTKIKQEIAELAGAISDEVVSRISKAYSRDSYKIYDRLAKLFRIIDKGSPDLNVPAYNGGLFRCDPDSEDTDQEACNARFLESTKVLDDYMARAIDLLSRDLDPKRGDLVFIDFKSLGVRHLGSIYEGLLEFRLKIAPEKMAVVKGKRTEEIIPYREAVKSNAKILKTGKGKDAKERVLRKGTIYLENDRRERKATGSYYTPEVIVKYIVEKTVGPVLEEKFEKMRPLLRKAQAEYREFFKRREAFEKQGLRPEPASKAELIGREMVDEFFDIKVLDPAMGSAHFLVEAVDFITDRALDFLNAFPWNPVSAHLAETRETIMAEMERQGISIDQERLTDVNLLKRNVLKRCIYGVDLNPVAVELAKVSLWLDSFTIGAPLSFLDHHIRCGNSLIGSTVGEVREKVESGHPVLWGSQFTGLMLATEAMRRVGELSDVTGAQIEESRSEYRRASDALAPFKRILDVYTSRWFGNTPTRVTAKRRTEVVDPTINFLLSSDSEAWINETSALDDLPDHERPIAETAASAVRRERFFHWELEFPEVFYEKGARKTDGGFDAFIGNPPYVRQESLGAIKPYLQDRFGDVYKGTADIYVYFYARGYDVLRPGGRFGMVTSNKFMRSDYGKPLRDFLASNVAVTDIVDFGDLPIFEDPSAYPCIVLYVKDRASEGVSFTRIGTLAFGEIDDIVKDFGIILSRDSFEAGDWSLSSPEEVAILRKMEEVGVPLGEYLQERGVEIRRGVLTGFNQAFIIDRETRDRLIDEDPHSAEIIKPLLIGKDIHRYRIDFRDRYLIFSRHGINIDEYPAVKQHLSQWKTQLMPKREKGQSGPGRKPGQYKWYEIQDTIDYYEQFEKPKIVFPDIAMGSNFAFDDDGKFFCANTVYILCMDDIPLLGVLNSKLLSFYCSRMFSTYRGGYLRYFAQDLKNIPLKLPDETTLIRELSKAVQNIVEINRDSNSLISDSEFDMQDQRLSTLDHQINKIVYKLYEIDDKQAKIIEENR